MTQKFVQRDFPSWCSVSLFPWSLVAPSGGGIPISSKTTNTQPHRHALHSSQYVLKLAHVNTLTGLVGGYAALRHAIAHQCLVTSRSCTTVAIRTAGRLQLDLIVKASGLIVEFSLVWPCFQLRVVASSARSTTNTEYITSRPRALQRRC
jgi:hypothetical protein